MICSARLLLTIYSKVVNLGLGVHIWNVPLTMFSPYFLKVSYLLPECKAS
jgi:hypothetical protein